MTAPHLRLEGTDEEIGKQLGRIAKAKHGCQLSELDPDLLKARMAWFKCN